MIRRIDCIELGIACADVCKSLDRGTNGRQEVDLSRPVLQAIERLTMQVELAVHTHDGSLTKP